VASRAPFDRRRLAAMTAGTEKAAFSRADVVELLGAQLPIDTGGARRAVTTVGRRFPVFGRRVDDGIMVEAAAVAVGALRSVKPGWAMVGDDTTAAPSGFWADRDGLVRG
jgi:hypothetical protein